MDSNKRITLINNAALSIINSSENESKGYPFEKVFPSEACDKLWNSVPGICEIECSLNGLQKIFLFSLSEYLDENKSINYILVFRDLTERRRIEKQAQRNDKMIALGELASSVAHEIRNPLNSIGTITQQIVKDFEVKENADEFKDFTNIVYGEVKRINNIIESFLKYAKPQPVNLEEFSFCNFINDLFKQYVNVLLQKSISYEIDCSLSEKCLSRQIADETGFYKSHRKFNRRDALRRKYKNISRVRKELFNYCFC
jgi:nitrogen fixation/metabolism regulation signal transduction histidine kinase